MVPICLRLVQARRACIALGAAPRAQGSQLTNSMGEGFGSQGEATEKTRFPHLAPPEQKDHPVGREAFRFAAEGSAFGFASRE
jgi:hypothetical protein